MTQIDPRMIELDKEVEKFIQKKNELEAELAEKKAKHGQVTWKIGARAEHTGEFKIHVQIAKLDKLIPFTSFLVRLKRDWVEACDLLGVPTTEKDPKLLTRSGDPINPATFEGHLVSDWLEDCKQRAAVIDMKKLETKISTLKTELEKTKSEYQKRKDAIQALGALLDD